MSKPIREEILSNPRLVLSEFKTEDIVMLKNSLEVTAKQILCKFGYMKLNSKGMDVYTIDEIFYKKCLMRQRLCFGRLTMLDIY